MDFDTYLINGIERDYAEVRHHSGYLPHETALRKAERRLGKDMASKMSPEEILNFIEGN